MYRNILSALVLASISATGLHAASDYPIKTCVVSGDAFGGDLGAPVDITYQGRTIRLCCKSCVKTFNKNPEKYVKKLDDAIKAQGGK